jgi:UDP-N-acetylglucosamine--N-acetylmuramyl-(pentapeptide) pyrophosphoryl-undecaprenol N-acetylglucosamine transferase
MVQSRHGPDAPLAEIRLFQHSRHNPFEFRPCGADVSPMIVERRESVPPNSVLYVCDSGGHLVEAVELAGTRFADATASWYTSDTPMARSLLHGQDVTIAARRVTPGAVWLAFRELVTATRFLRRRRFDAVVSTGSAYALPWMIAARLTRHDAVFVESAARTHGLSRVGRMIERVPGTRLVTQAPLEVDGWEQWPSVLDTACGRRTQRAVPRSGPVRVLVTVGTMHFPFDRLLDRVDAVVPADWELVVQHGASRSIERAGRNVAELGYDELGDAMRDADVVIAHCGVGTIISAAHAGVPCVLLPRRAAFGEVIDDHQFQLIPVLAGHPGITTVADEDEITTELLTAVVDAGRSSARPGTLRYAMH